MGWKNVKEHYRIGHIVCVKNGNIIIGSDYISDLIIINPSGKVCWGAMGPCGNDDLARYHTEMTADAAKLRELIEKPDVFARSLPVYTYDDGSILEKHCEEYGWPNISNDGCLMYENTFFKNKDDAVRKAKINAMLGAKWAREHLEEAEKNLIKRRECLAEKEAIRAKFDADYPGIVVPDEDE